MSTVWCIGGHAITKKKIWVITQNYQAANNLDNYPKNWRRRHRAITQTSPEIFFQIMSKLPFITALNYGPKNRHIPNRPLILFIKIIKTEPLVYR